MMFERGNLTLLGAHYTLVVRRSSPGSVRGPSVEDVVGSAAAAVRWVSPACLVLGALGDLRRDQQRPEGEPRLAVPGDCAAATEQLPHPVTGPAAA